MFPKQAFHWLRLLLAMPVLLTLPLTGCLAPEGPFILQAQETPVIDEEGEVIGGVDEELAVQVEEATVEALTPGEDVGFVAATDLENVLVQATFLLEHEVENLAGDAIGDVEDLVIDIQSGQVMYVIFDQDRFLGLADADRPIPLAAFRWNPDFEMALALDEETIEAIPQINDEWPFGIEVAWDDGIADFWLEHDLLPVTDPEALPARLSDLIGIHAGGLGDELGTVEDFLLDLGQERVGYMGIFMADGFYDPNLVLIVPFAATTLDIEGVDGSSLYALTLLAVDEAVLDAAPAIDRSIFLTVDFLDQAFTEELSVYWQEQGYPAE